VRHLLNEFKETPRERGMSGQRGAWRQGYFALVKTLVRFERWDLILDGTTIPTYEKPEQQAWRHWAIGLAQAAQGKVDEARKTHEKMQEFVKAATASKRALAIGELELEATIAARGGDTKKGYEVFRKAADMEAALIYTEPPSYPRPVVEGLGATALAMGDGAVAEKAYREALEREPGSGRAYFGIAAALKAQNKMAEAQQMTAKAMKAWDKADSDLPQLRGAATTAAGASQR
jgi:tetratricopeptide (TPR) repeat protein